MITLLQLKSFIELEYSFVYCRYHVWFSFTCEVGQESSELSCKDLSRRLSRYDFFFCSLRQYLYPINSIWTKSLHALKHCIEVIAFRKISVKQFDVIGYLGLIVILNTIKKIFFAKDRALHYRCDMSWKRWVQSSQGLTKRCLEGVPSVIIKCFLKIQMPADQPCTYYEIHERLWFYGAFNNLPVKLRKDEHIITQALHPKFDVWLLL